MIWYDTISIYDICLIYYGIQGIVRTFFLWFNQQDLWPRRGTVASAPLYPNCSKNAFFCKLFTTHILGTLYLQKKKTLLWAKCVITCRKNVQYISCTWVGLKMNYRLTPSSLSPVSLVKLQEFWVPSPFPDTMGDLRIENVFCFFFLGELSVRLGVALSQSVAGLLYWWCRFVPGNVVMSCRKLYLYIYIHIYIPVPTKNGANPIMNSFVGPCFSIPPKRSIYKLGWIGDGLLVCLPHYTIWLYLICPGDCAWQWQISHCCRFWSKVISLKSYDFPAMLNFKNWMTALFLQQIPIVGGKNFRSFQDFCSTHTRRVALCEVPTSHWLVLWRTGYTRICCIFS
jgi:hypothetical protein